MNTGSNNGGRGESLSIMKQPRFYPIVTFSRTINGIFDINCTGIAPSTGTFAFTLNQLPAYTDYTNLFQQYRILRVKINWKPEYTELTDAAPISNAVNVNFNTALDPSDPTPPATVDNVTEYQTCLSTGITKQHSRSFKPAIITANGMLCTECFIASNNPGERHYGVKYGIPPTGVAMVFRSTCTVKFQCAGSR
jgi:hypothetical protein